MRKRVLAVGLALAVLATAGFAFMHRPGTALAASSYTTVCLDNSNLNPCLNYESSTNTINLINTYSSPPLSAQWNLDPLGTVSTLQPFTYEQFNDDYSSSTVYYIEKKDSSGGHDGCIGYDNDSIGKLIKVSCSGTVAEWVYSSLHYFVNVKRTNDTGTTTPAKWLMSVQPIPGGGCQDQPFNVVYVNKQNYCNEPWFFT